ncbi:unnamed protein product, partial [Scytosiphon promiscuus]
MVDRYAKNIHGEGEKYKIGVVYRAMNRHTFGWLGAIQCNEREESDAYYGKYSMLPSRNRPRFLILFIPQARPKLNEFCGSFCTLEHGCIYPPPKSHPSLHMLAPRECGIFATCLTRYQYIRRARLGRLRRRSCATFRR